MSNDSFESAADAAAEAASVVLTPVQRLELSRARMRVFLDRRKPVRESGDGMSASNIGAKVSDWADGLRANPVMGAVIDAVHGWWTSHPLHSVALMAGDAVEDVAAPWIRRYPLAVVTGALAVGVVAARLRPWRWLGRPALLAGLTSQIAAQLMTNAPLEFMIDAFTKFAKPKNPAPAEASQPQAPDSGSDMAEDSAGIDPAASIVTPVPSAVRVTSSEAASAL